MSIADSPIRPIVTPSLPPLESGDRLDQPTFHARYAAMPANVRAELIEGVVYVSSPVRIRHGKPHTHLTTWLGVYTAATPGVEALVDSTAILGDQSEPQPDVALLTVGGQTKETADGYVSGAPELVCEVAAATESIDLHAKKRDYERHGAVEYLVVAVRVNRAFWFVRGEGNAYVELPADADGLFRSRVYPGLWLDPAALLRGDLRRVLDALAEGLRSPAHAAFAERVKPKG